MRAGERFALAAATCGALAAWGCARNSAGATAGAPPGAPSAPASRSALADRYRGDADRLIDAALADSAAYARLGRLADGFGSRFSGSPSLERAIDWVLDEMRRDGLENVRGVPVSVPHWVRGAASLERLSRRAQTLHLLKLGGSVGTPREGITAEVLVVGSFDELVSRAGEARGKIVLFDVPFAGDRAPFQAYRDVVRYRAGGAVAAARVGAVASLVRSVTPHSLSTPHTGGMRYDSTVARIPSAAVSVEDAALLHRLRDRGERVVATLRMEAQTLPDAPSRNVVAEIVGRERPQEEVVLGGHIDSWDVGQGATDDGGGSVAAWEAVRLMKRLGMRPRRTVRVVLWTNEENGLRGGLAYRAAHAAEVANHVLAIESDAGTFSPTGFGVGGTDSTLAVARAIAPLLARVGAGTMARGEDEADISPLVAAGAPGMGLQVDPSRYFWYHHADADTMDKLDPRELARCVATLAVMAYVVAEMPERLPRGAPTAAAAR